MDILEIDESQNFEVIANSSSKYPFLKDLDLDQDVTRRVSLLLDGIKKGDDEVLCTPLVKSTKPEVILDKVDELFNSNKHLMNDPLINLELANRSKFGPRSIALPWNDRYNSLCESYEGRTQHLPSLADKITLNGVKLDGRLRPITIDKSVKLMKNNTNSGLPFYCRKSKIKERLISEYETLLERKDPCLLFTRTQESKKTRNVWGYPAADTCRENRYYVHLLEYQRKLSWRAAIVGPEEVDRQITHLLLLSKSLNLKLVSIDFSSFDASVKLELISKAFSYIASLFQEKFRPDIEAIMQRFVSIQIVTPSGVFTGNHGVPSGSSFTNEVDSLAQFFAAISSGLVKDGHFQIQGDDGVYLVEEDKVKSFFDAFKHQGLKVNDDINKSAVADDYCVYLQCLYHTQYLKNGLVGGIYPIYRALNRLIYQERWSDFEDFGLSGKDYYSIRAISILENCKHHPLFEEFVKLIYTLDKYSLAYTKEGVSKYCDLLRNGSGTWGTLYNQYGDDVKGLSSFETVKVLRSIA